MKQTLHTIGTVVLAVIMPRPARRIGHLQDLRTGPQLTRAALALVLLTLCAVSAPPAFGQNSNDGFDPNANGWVWATAVQADGKIIIGGEFGIVGGTSRSRLARLNPDGSVETTFNPGANGPVYSLVKQADGKTLVGGSFTSLGGQSRTNLARLNTDGSLDASFNPGANGEVRVLKVQPDGKILVGGNFTTLGGQPRSDLARLNANGTLDIAFTPGANGEVRSLAVQADGKILVGGYFTSLAEQPRYNLGRLNADGTLDAAFTPGANDWVLSFVVQPDGKILVGGTFTALGGQAHTNLARLNSNGTVDTAFTSGANSGVWTLVLQPDGKILVGGLFTTLAGQPRTDLGRLNADGTLDTTFTPAANDWVLSLAVQADGKIVAGGFFTTLGGKSRNRIARLYADGSVDASCDPGANGAVHALAMQPDGKMVVGGAFTVLGGQTRNRMARLSPDGSLDTAFNPSGNSAVYAVAVQSDGKLLAGGAFTMMGAQSRSYLARLNANGTLDTGFSLAANGEVYAFALQTNGQVLVSGNFTTLGGQPRNYLARLNASGTVDATFSPAANGAVRTLAVQPDGKILVGGHFTTLGGQARNYLARLQANGNLDTAFNPNPNAAVYSLAVQTDGKIVVGGYFTTLAGQTRYYLGRLDSDGGLDPGFTDPQTDDSVWSLALQTDGRILLGGDFTRFGANTYNRIGRLNSDGTVDTGFHPEAGAAVYSLAAQPDGKILVGGVFTTLGGRPCNYIGRLTGGSEAEQSLTLGPGGSTVTWSRSGTGPELQQVTFEQSQNGVTYNLLGNGTRVSGGWQLSGLSPSAGEYFYIRARGRTLGGLHAGSSGLIESVQQFIMPSTNASLSGLVVSEGTLSPGFDPATTSYTVGVPNEVGHLTITPTVAGDDAWLQMRINHGPYHLLPSGTPSEVLLLSTGTNLLEVLVTAQDLVTVKTYAVRIIRAPAPTPWLGPFYPAPQGVSLIAIGGDGAIGRATNMIWLFSNIPVASEYPTYWGATNGGVKLSMDDNLYTGDEILTYQPALSSLAGGVSVWSGQTTIPSPVRTVYTRFILAVTNYFDGLPIPMSEAVNLGLPANAGGLTYVTPGLAFTAALRFDASYSTNGPWEPALDFYDREVTNWTTRVYSSFAGAFYLLNHPPNLAANEPLTVNRSGSGIITSALLAATDADTGADQLRFTVAPQGEGGPPRNGVLRLYGTNVAAGGSCSQTDINNGRLSYLHNGNCETSDDFTFNVTDDAGGAAPTGAYTTYTFRIRMAQPNLPPVAADGNFATGLQAPYHGFLPGTNLDCTPQTLTYCIVDLPGKGEVVINDTHTGAFTYTPQAGRVGQDSFTYQVNDGLVDAASRGTMSISISNLPPTAVAGSATTRENVAINGTLTANNPDVPDTLTFAFVTPATKGAAVLTDAATGAFTYTPNPAAIGSDQFAFTVSDGVFPPSAPAVFTVTIRPNLDEGDLLVADGSGKVVLIDHSGVQFVVASGGLLGGLRGVTVDRDGQILVMSQNTGLVRIDPANGAQTLVSSKTNFSSAGFGAWGIAAEPAGTILVADGVNGVARVNPVTGVPAILAAGNQSPLWMPFGVTLAPNGEIWVTDPGAQTDGVNGLLRINPATGAPTLVSSNGNFTLPAGAAVEASGNVVVANYPDQVLRINPTNGTQTVVSAGGMLNASVGLAMKPNGVIYVVNIAGNGTVVQVDPITGAQSLFATGFANPGGIAVVSNPMLNRLFGMAQTSSGLALRFQGLPGLSYILERSTTFSAWEPVAAADAAADGVAQFVDSDPPAGGAFYRVRWP
jgi:uncharacterized delta-60 repeat protein